MKGGECHFTRRGSSTRTSIIASSKILLQKFCVLKFSKKPFQKHIQTFHHDNIFISDAVS